MLLNDIRYGNEHISATIGLLLNSLLMYLTLTERNSTLRSYNRMIAVSCSMDIIYTVLEFFLMTETILVGDFYICVFVGLARHFPQWVCCFFGAAHIFLIGMETVVAPVDYFFRYCLVCRKTKLSVGTLLSVLLASSIPIATVAALFQYSFDANSNSTTLQNYEPYVREEQWIEPSGKTFVFIVCRASNRVIILAFLLVVSIEATSYVACLWFGVRINRELDSVKDVLSVRTQKLQRRMNWILAAKIIHPLIFVSSPCMLVVVSMFFGFRVPYLGFVIVNIIGWVPVVGPATTLFLITNYRQRLRRVFASKPVTSIETRNSNSAGDRMRRRQSSIFGKGN